MSFSISAIGTKEEVAAQLEAANIPGGEARFNALGTELRDLLVRHFGAEAAQAGEGHEYRYVVKASGHGGGTSPMYLQVNVESHWIPVAVQTSSISGDAEQDTPASE